jgi:hypothetical protein
MSIEILVSGLTCLVLGFIAGYLFHGWEFDKELRVLEQALNDLEHKYMSEQRWKR